MALLSTGTTSNINAIEPRYSHTIELVQNDTRPQLTFSLIDDNTQLPIDLTNATAIKLHLREETSATIKISVPMYISGLPTEGSAFLQWPDGALDTSGWFVGEIEIIYGTGIAAEIQTVYEEIKFKIRPDYKAA